MKKLLVLNNLCRSYNFGCETFDVLKGINLTVNTGEFIAIMGASGSGKSTLMNILGCLDQATSGSYQINGQEVSCLSDDELATLRREYFGFIFQRYHLLTQLSALDNVEVPAIYANVAKNERLERSKNLLFKVGLQDRLHYYPNQLSGGQQQRVSIARALINGGQIILADEPTGALDSKSSIEILNLLHELHRNGHTIILVTHDANVAAHANRLIKISDGEIVEDVITKNMDENYETINPVVNRHISNKWQIRVERFWEAFKFAKVALLSHKMRSLLTMLGIIIGIAAVVSVVALGQGAQNKIINDINSMGTNVIWIFPGKDWGDKDAYKIQTLVQADVDALQKQFYVDSVTPIVSKGDCYIQSDNINIKGSINGVGEQFFRVQGYELEAGRYFTKEENFQYASVAVIDYNTRKQFFSSTEEALGKIIFFKSIPCQIVGVTKEKEFNFGNANELRVWLPYQTFMMKFLGQHHFSCIVVRVKDGISSQLAQNNLTKLLTIRHGNCKDFFTNSSDSILKTVEKTTATMKLLITSIAFISLLVGGIGVMNIMLVSVSEQTHEIGIRMAVGARKYDILQQFLISAVLLCLIGGICGILFSLLIGCVFSYLVGAIQFSFSLVSILVAVICSSLIGITFGFIPARNAARLNPVDALMRD